MMGKYPVTFAKSRIIYSIKVQLEVSNVAHRISKSSIVKYKLVYRLVILTS